MKNQFSVLCSSNWPATEAVFKVADFKSVELNAYE
jgi:hypothetical protein